MRIAPAIVVVFATGMLSASPLYASPVFVDWTSIDDTTNTAAGALNGIAVSVATTNGSGCLISANGGVVGGVTNGTSTSFSNGSYFTPSIASTDAVSLCSSSSFVFTFAQAVTDLTLHLAQMAGTTVTFDSSFTLVSSDGDFSPVTATSIRGSAAGASPDDANGSLLFSGPFSSLSWTASTPDFGDGVGIQFSIDVPMVPEPSTLALFGLGLAGLGFGKRRLIAARRRC